MINARQTSRLLAATMSPTLGIFQVAPPFVSCCGARFAIGTFSIEKPTIKEPSLPRSAPASGSCGQVEPKQLWGNQIRLIHGRMARVQEAGEFLVGMTIALHLSCSWETTDVIAMLIQSWCPCVMLAFYFLNSCPGDFGAH